MDGSPAISRTHGRTDARTHARTGLISPFPTKVGGLKRGFLALKVPRGREPEFCQGQQ